MKNITFLFFLFFVSLCNAQETGYIDSKVIKDSISIYKITLIEKDYKEYIIHAVKDEYHFRIKSSIAENICTNGEEIKLGHYYQLDIRDYEAENIRTLYSTKYQGMGFCQPLESGHSLCEYDPKVLNTFSQVLNLKGLCLMKE
jgi:hypothetical protein